MKLKTPMRTLSAAIAIATLAGCGGGGGGGGAPAVETPRELTPLPEFLQAKTAECSFIENDNNVSLENYTGNLANVTGLTCDNAALTNLSGINQLTALAELTLTNSGLENINDLLNNSTLEKLNLSGNPLNDLSALNSIESLTELDLSKANLSATTALLDLVNLAKLNLENNPLTDLAALASLISLTDLDLSGIGLTDTSALAALTSLQNLDLSDNELQLVTELSNLVQLTALDLTNNVITDVLPLASLTAMESLQLSGNDTLECSNAFQLKNSLNENAVDSMPTACDNVITLGNTSPESETIDNSLLEEPYGRVVIVGDYTADDLLMLKQGDNLALRLNTSEGERAVIFTGWFLDEANTVKVFEMPGGEEYSFSGLRELTPLGRELSDAIDTYDGSPDRDLIYGLDGNDIINGNGDEDVIVGGKGNDKLAGGSVVFDGQVVINVVPGSYDDTYVYNKGDGKDTIYHRSQYGNRTGILQFGAEISGTDIALKRNGDDLILYFDDSNQITFYKWFYTSLNRVRSLVFGEADPLDANVWVQQTGYSSDSGIIDGTNDEDYLIGTSNSDTILGRGSSDILIGGLGDDILSGGTVEFDGQTVVRVAGTISSDTYIYNRGDGKDTIYHRSQIGIRNGILQFGADVSETEITLQRIDDDLIFYFDDSNQITFYKWFESKINRVESLVFGEADPINVDEWVESRLNPTEPLE